MDQKSWIFSQNVINYQVLHGCPFLPTLHCFEGGEEKGHLHLTRNTIHQKYFSKCLLYMNRLFLHWSAVLNCIFIPLYHFSLLHWSTFPVNEEEWFTLSSLSSHSSGRTSSQFKVLIPGYVLETSNQDFGATLECAQAVLRHLSLLTVSDLEDQFVSYSWCLPAGFNLQGIRL